MPKLLPLVALLILPWGAHAQGIGNPTCQDIADLVKEVGIDEASPFVRGYVIGDWEQLDTVPAPGQGPIAPILESNPLKYGNEIDPYCNADPTEPLSDAVRQAYLADRIKLFGRLPK